MERMPMGITEDERGLVELSSPYSFDQTLGRIEAVLREADVNLFCVVDHGGEAERAGLTMRPTKLLLFGNPVAGTPVMVASPTAGLDLPLKALVWQAEDGQVWVAYNSPAYFQRRHGIQPDLVTNISAAESLLQMALT
jgi:uncharacterized protein (DUF302 family)